MFMETLLESEFRAAPGGAARRLILLLDAGVR